MAVVGSVRGTRRTGETRESGIGALRRHRAPITLRALVHCVAHDEQGIQGRQQALLPCQRQTSRLLPADFLCRAGHTMNRGNRGTGKLHSADFTVELRSSRKASSIAGHTMNRGNTGRQG